MSITPPSNCHTRQPTHLPEGAPAGATAQPTGAPAGATAQATTAAPPPSEEGSDLHEPAKTSGARQSPRSGDCGTLDVSLRWFEAWTSSVVRSKAHTTRSAVSDGSAIGRLTGTRGASKAHTDHSRNINDSRRSLPSRKATTNVDRTPQYHHNDTSPSGAAASFGVQSRWATRQSWAEHHGSCSAESTRPARTGFASM